MLFRTAALALSLALLSACTSTLDAQRLRADFAASAPVFSSRTVEEVSALRPQLSLPCRVVVAPPVWRAQPDWSASERAELSTWGAELEERGLASEFVLMPSTTVDLGAKAQDDQLLERLRVAGARHQADVLLVIRDATERCSWQNALAVLDLTLVAAWLVPGHSAEAVCLMDALVIDNRNEYLYLSGHGEGAAKATRPLAYIDELDLEAQARAAALASLKDDLFARLREDLRAARAQRGG